MPRVRGMHGKRLDDAIERVESLVARVLRGIARTVASLVGGSPSTAALSEDDLQVIRREWNAAVGAELVPALSEAYLQSAETLATEFADAGRPIEPVSLDAPEAADFLDAATNRLVAVSDTLWEVARKELADGVRAGEGVEELAARLQEAGGFGEARARMIARTEVVAAANAASLAQAMRLGDPSMTKTWTDADDDRVRPAHALADGQTVPVGEPFEVGGESLMYPGQPTGSAANVINERCTQVYGWDDMDDPLTAAAEVHTGAMVALRPSVEDTERLAVDGGEPADQLHATLAYLGAAVDIPVEAQQAIIGRLRALVEDAICPDYDLPLIAEGFAIDVFNPPGAVREDDKDRDTCIVLGLSGGDLEPVHGMVGEAVREVFKEAGLALPEQHTPWIPHITLTYTDDVGRVAELTDRTGPVAFDAIRVAFGGENTDIPLTPVTPTPPSVSAMRVGTVVSPDGETLIVSVDGAHLPDVRNLSTYKPQVGDTVALASLGGSWVAIGKVVEPPTGGAPGAGFASETDTADPAVPDEDDDFDWDAYVTQAIQAQFQSRMPPQLQRFWIRKLRLGTKSSFRRCVRELREYFPEDTEGLCANLYHEATGRWPGRKKGNASVDKGAEGDVVALAGDLSSSDLATDDESNPLTPDPLGAQPGEHFHTRVLEGVSTGMRQFGPGAITWRTPPFAYHWQYKSSAHNGVPETVQVGLVTRAKRDDPTVHFWGKLDLHSPEGLDYARRLVEGFARWSSVGADESMKERHIDVEYVLADDTEPGAPVEEPEIDLMTFNEYRVAEISGVSVPALADATVEPTQELIDTLVAMGVIEPAQVAEPPAVEEIQEDEVANFAAVRPHDTPTTEGTWDADANVGRLPTPLPVTKAREEFAWIDDSRIEGDHIPKDAGSLPHHEVSEDGRVGAANIDGVRNALTRLSQTDIPESEREAVHAHLARHLEDAGGNPSEFAAHGPSVVVASGRTITLPEAPPAAWFEEPADDELPPFGSVRVDANGRLVGLLAPAQVNHRSFPGKKVKVPMGRVDYSGWQNKPLEVAEGHTIRVGVITKDCNHASTTPGDWSYTHRREHYENTCSIAARACAYEKPGIGVALAGAIVPWLDAEGFGKLLSSDLSGDWPQHPDKPGWRDFTAALAVPVGGFPNRAKLRLAEGQLVAAAVPVQFDDDVEALVEMEEEPVFAEGTRVRVVNPRDPEVTEGEIAMVHTGPAYALMVPGREEPHRWYVADEIEPVGDTDEVDEAEEELVASAGPDLRPALERVAKSVGLDAATRMASLHARVHQLQ